MDEAITPHYLCVSAAEEHQVTTLMKLMQMKFYSNTIHFPRRLGKSLHHRQTGEFSFTVKHITYKDVLSRQCLTKFGIVVIKWCKLQVLLRYFLTCQEWLGRYLAIIMVE